MAPAAAFSLSSCKISVWSSRLNVTGGASASESLLLGGSVGDVNRLRQAETYRTKQSAGRYSAGVSRAVVTPPMTLASEILTSRSLSICQMAEMQYTPKGE